MTETTTRYAYDMAVTVLVDSQRGYEPEQPYEISGEFLWDGPYDPAGVEKTLVDGFLDRFVADNSRAGYTRDRLLHGQDPYRWSLVTGGRVSRLDVREVPA
jgi:hypothetical protein